MRDLDLVALAAEHDAEHLGEGGVVVDDQDTAATGPVLGSGGWHGAHSALLSAKSRPPARVRSPGGWMEPISTGSGRS